MGRLGERETWKRQSSPRHASPLSRVTPSPSHHKDGVLEAIYAPDGRLVAEYPFGGNRSEGDISRFVAEYRHQGHPGPPVRGQALGNTQLSIAE